MSEIKKLVSQGRLISMPPSVLKSTTQARLRLAKNRKKASPERRKIMASMIRKARKG